MATKKAAATVPAQEQAAKGRCQPSANGTRVCKHPSTSGLSHANWLSKTIAAVAAEERSVDSDVHLQLHTTYRFNRLWVLQEELLSLHLPNRSWQ